MLCYVMYGMILLFHFISSYLISFQYITASDRLSDDADYTITAADVAYAQAQQLLQQQQQAQAQAQANIQQLAPLNTQDASVNGSNASTPHNNDNNPLFTLAQVSPNSKTSAAGAIQQPI